MEWLKNIFRRKTAYEMAAQELAIAELSILEANSACEYAASVIDYNKARITRLRGFLAAQPGCSSRGAAEVAATSSPANNMAAARTAGGEPSC